MYLSQNPSLQMLFYHFLRRLFTLIHSCWLFYEVKAFRRITDRSTLWMMAHRFFYWSVYSGGKRRPHLWGLERRLLRDYFKANRVAVSSKEVWLASPAFGGALPV
jgi:hypothetical protein